MTPLPGHLPSIAGYLGLAIVALALTACDESVRLGDGKWAPDSPKQWVLESPPPPLAMNGVRLAPRAGYQITAKVLSKRRYRWDELAAVATWDFALGWGVMSDEAMLARLKVVQGDRFMFWHLYDAPVDIKLVNRLSANVHLIAANDSVLQGISDVPKGAIVTLSGELVDVHFQDHTVIPSSLTRWDTGPGACEILLVQDLSVIHPRNEGPALTAEAM
ncbi:MAG: hypothetical protein NWP69_13340 [Congregibacter sp.]|nr:hypothetical protein [Congregibacter sp.]